MKKCVLNRARTPAFGFAFSAPGDTLVRAYGTIARFP